MSTLTSTTNLVAECQRRVPIGLADAHWMRKLNEAYRWISQKGNYVWDVKKGTVAVGVGATTFTIPSDCDPGKPMYLSGNASLPTLIPYKPWDETLMNQGNEVAYFGTMGVNPVPGLYSVWSFYTTFSAGPPTSYAYTGILYPASAAPTGTTGQFNLAFAYHTDVSGVEFTQATNVYFPTPNSFDNLLIELAEAETRRIYGLAGWDIIQKRAESAIVNLLDSYRSTKNVLSGLVDQQKQVQEANLMRQERG